MRQRSFCGRLIRRNVGERLPFASRSLSVRAGADTFESNSDLRASRKSGATVAGACRCPGLTVGQARGHQESSTSVPALAGNLPRFHACWCTQFMTTVGECTTKT